MFFSASIKPTSTVHALWVARTKTCGFVEGVCFVRKNTVSGPRYVADKITDAQLNQVRNNAAVQIAITAARTPEKIEDSEAETIVMPTIEKLQAGFAEAVATPSKLPQPPKKVK